MPSPATPSPEPPAPSPPARLILASSSPRRRELLAEAGYAFTVVPPAEDVECGVCSEFGPAGLVADLAYRKARAVYQQLVAAPTHTHTSPESTAPSSESPTYIIGADTVAECDGFILGKPRDETMARAMLTQLSGREHRVLTGVCIIPLPFREELGEGSVTHPDRQLAQPIIRVAVTKLRMDQLADTQLDEYLDSGQWEGKAGSFGYQDRLGWVHIVEGSASNVVGLPLELLAEMLAECSSSGKTCAEHEV